jgi:hypothetical protein
MSGLSDSQATHARWLFDLCRNIVAKIEEEDLLDELDELT